MSIGLVDFANNQTMAVSLHACALGGHLTRCYTTGHKHKYVGQVCGLRAQERDGVPTGPGLVVQREGQKANCYRAGRWTQLIIYVTRSYVSSSRPVARCDTMRGSGLWLLAKVGTLKLL